MVISVSLGAQSYPILLEPGALARAGEHLSLDRRVLVVTDSGVPQEYAQAIASRCQQPHICTLPAGESSKSMDSYHLLLWEMLRLHMDRGDCVAAGILLHHLRLDAQRAGDDLRQGGGQVGSRLDQAQ